MKTADVAIPLALVVAVFKPPANVPLAPLTGAVNVTSTPLTGLLPASFTVATKGAANAVLIAALCGVPLVVVMEAGVAAPTPVPATPRVCGLGEPLFGTLMVAARALLAVGVNCTPKLQAAPMARTLVPKLHAEPAVGATTAKSPGLAPTLVVAAFRVTLAVPLLVMVTFWVVLVVETFWLAKVSEAGFMVMAPPPAPLMVKPNCNGESPPPGRGFEKPTGTSVLGVVAALSSLPGMVMSNTVPPALATPPVLSMPLKMRSVVLRNPAPVT